MNTQTIKIDTEDLWARLENSAGKHVKSMSLEDLRDMKQVLSELIEAQESGTVAKACLREAMSWLNEQIVGRIMEDSQCTGQKSES